MHDRDQIDVQPMLKRIARPLSSGIGGVMEALGTSKVSVETGDIRSVTCKDWYAPGDEAMAHCLFQLAPVKGAAALRLNADFITVLVDMFFGGAVAAPSRTISEFSRTDMRLIHRIANLIGDQLAKSWAAHGPFRCTLAGISSEPDEGQIAPASAMLIIQPFDLVYPGNIRLTLEIAYPLDMLQSAKEITTPAQAQTEEPDADPIWQRDLADALSHVHLPVRSVLARPEMTLPQLAELKPGDMIPIPPARNLPLLVGDKIFARGSMGEQNGMAAFRIDSIEKG
ncbi:flagellar motor switch protein FliM [Alterisphingorhabdus coralli]|uniref:Flagellar motor switch protein FliM n=1 Tax=Alterisphingorhabdus coralli TaxID=3071408 RepID=A0AA97F823_9SPHN|nr:FliM/FliN family flagellar motor switch protein [Parasphingorhabdus sp. SCSIO 66989]WOE74772.1 FliM/FliN family flagellar motor switch protein [Parasphingorhabdus sp. SCSIO 66989]